MRDIILFIAASLDGFIARPDGSVDWLFTDGDYGYQAFYDSIDVVLMGRKTYEQTLEFGAYPFSDKKGYVFSRSPDVQAAEGVEVVAEDPASLAWHLKSTPGKNIWLVGGLEIISIFIKAGLIDEYVISVHPVILGDGIPLFPTGIAAVQLDLVGVKFFDSGLVQLTYRTRPAA
ncbi:MAG: dihydrofolate reductase family protein [Anaerolineae bacterium]